MNITTRQSLSEIAPTKPIQAIGDLRLIADNRLNERVKFESLNKKPHLYGLAFFRLKPHTDYYILGGTDVGLQTGWHLIVSS